jgi:HSP20 family protein
MPKFRRSPDGGVPGIPDDLLFHTEGFLDRLSVGTWGPNIDLCETAGTVVVRVELPGVDPADVVLTMRDSVLRLQGIKREPAVSHKLLCYYCVERRYGKFTREIRIHSVVNPQRARAHLKDGILTIEMPKLAERRGKSLEIPITKK